MCTIFNIIYCFHGCRSGLVCHPMFWLAGVQALHHTFNLQPPHRSTESIMHAGELLQISNPPCCNPHLSLTKTSVSPMLIVPEHMCIVCFTAMVRSLYLFWADLGLSNCSRSLWSIGIHRQKFLHVNPKQITLGQPFH